MQTIQLWFKSSIERVIILTEKKYVITFNSTYHAIRGEKLLLNENLIVRTIPTPREITESCGLSIKFIEEDLEKIKYIIKENDLNIKGIYELSKDKKSIKLM